jgi:uncharacterized protein YecE (DUF72 family)
LPRSSPAKATDPPTAKAEQAAAPSIPFPQNLFAGTSGWAYPTWKPGFYPANVPARAFLQHYATQLNAVEVNYTFRTLPTPKQLQTWLDASPATFRFSFKAPQRITHFERLRLAPSEAPSTLASFLAALEPAHAASKLGPLLFQLPPNFSADPHRLDAFLESVASTTTYPMQLTFEFRHASWFQDATYDILRRHNAALCIAESDDLVTPDIPTADFRCYRLRRSGGYTPAELDAFAARFRDLAATAPTYIFFRHEDDPTGALNARSMLLAAAGAPR